jgi:hypothetical protein
LANEERTGASITLGVVVGLMMGCMAGGGAGWVVKTKIGNGARDWQLVPVVVAAVDIEDDTVITFDMISQRSVPERFSTHSIVKPDSASYVVNQPVHAPLKAGDPLLWPEFEQYPCAAAIEQLAKAHASPDVDALLRQARLRLKLKTAPED